MAASAFVGITIFLLGLSTIFFVLSLVRAFQIRLKRFFLYWLLGSVSFVVAASWPWLGQMLFGVHSVSTNDLANADLGIAVSGFFLVMAMGGFFAIPAFVGSILVFGLFLAMLRTMLGMLFSR